MRQLDDLSSALASRAPSPPSLAHLRAVSQRHARTRQIGFATVSLIVIVIVAGAAVALNSSTERVETAAVPEDRHEQSSEEPGADDAATSLKSVEAEPVTAAFLQSLEGLSVADAVVIGEDAGYRVATYDLEQIVGLPVIAEDELALVLDSSGVVRAIVADPELVIENRAELWYNSPQLQVFLLSLAGLEADEALDIAGQAGYVAGAYRVGERPNLTDLRWDRIILIVDDANRVLEATNG